MLSSDCCTQVGYYLEISVWTFDGSDTGSDIPTQCPTLNQGQNMLIFGHSFSHRLWVVFGYIVERLHTRSIVHRLLIVRHTYDSKNTKSSVKNGVSSSFIPFA